MGMNGVQGTRKAARAVRLPLAQNQHADGDQHEGEERADIGEVGQRADVEDARRNGDEESRHPGGDIGRAEAAGGRGENAGGSRPSRDMANHTRAWPS